MSIQIKEEMFNEINKEKEKLEQEQIILDK